MRPEMNRNRVIKILKDKGPLTLEELAKEFKIRWVGVTHYSEARILDVVRRILTNTDESSDVFNMNLMTKKWGLRQNPESKNPETEKKKKRPLDANEIIIDDPEESADLDEIENTKIVSSYKPLIEEIQKSGKARPEEKDPERILKKQKLSAHVNQAVNKVVSQIKLELNQILEDLEKRDQSLELKKLELDKERKKLADKELSLQKSEQDLKQKAEFVLKTIISGVR